MAKKDERIEETGNKVDWTPFLPWINKELKDANERKAKDEYKFYYKKFYEKEVPAEIQRRRQRNERLIQEQAKEDKKTKQEEIKLDKELNLPEVVNTDNLKISDVQKLMELDDFVKSDNLIVAWKRLLEIKDKISDALRNNINEIDEDKLETEEKTLQKRVIEMMVKEYNNWFNSTEHQNKVIFDKKASDEEFYPVEEQHRNFLLTGYPIEEIDDLIIDTLEDIKDMISRNEI